jgi:hypothetical protein
MWSYKLPIELSLFFGYFMARVGWHEVAALVTALVLTVEYHYAVSQLPRVYSSVVQLSVCRLLFSSIFFSLFYLHSYVLSPLTSPYFALGTVCTIHATCYHKPLVDCACVLFHKCNPFHFLPQYLPRGIWHSYPRNICLLARVLLS